ncbi:MAG: hypothetical protein AB8B57_03020 [Congregibacter sp.]
MRLLGLLAAMLLMVSCGDAQADTRAEAEAAFRSYVDAVSTGKSEFAASMYEDAPGFHWVEQGAIQYESADEAAASLLAISESGAAPRMTVNILRVAELGDGAALVSAQFDFDLLSDTGDSLFSFGGWMTVGMVKRTGGWRIAGGQTTSEGRDLPL